MLEKVDCNLQSNSRSQHSTNNFHRAVKIKKPSAKYCAVGPKMKENVKDLLKILLFFEQNIQGKLIFHNFYLIFIGFLPLRRKYIPLQDKPDFFNNSSYFGGIPTFTPSPSPTLLHRESLKFDTCLNSHTTLGFCIWSYKRQIFILIFREFKITFQIFFKFQKIYQLIWLKRANAESHNIYLDHPFGRTVMYSTDGATTSFIPMAVLNPLRGCLKHVKGLSSDKVLYGLPSLLNLG